MFMFVVTRRDLVFRFSSGAVVILSKLGDWDIEKAVLLDRDPR